MKRYSPDEIDLARQLRRQGLPWEPAPGHYVYDETGFCPNPSPFQERVYFILNYPYFMKAVGGVENFKQMMTWLPTWSDVRLLLEDRGVTSQEVEDYLRENQSLSRGDERHALLKLLSETYAPTRSAVES